MKAKKKTNSGVILGSLLESSKTTAELAQALGYVDPQGTPRYNAIDRDLRNLVAAGYITGEKKKVATVGNTPTLYSIVFDISVLKNMLDTYPYLVTQMQKNDLVLNKIAHESLSSILDLKILEELEKRNEHMVFEESEENFRELKDWYLKDDPSFKHKPSVKKFTSITYKTSSIRDFEQNPKINEMCRKYNEDLREKLKLSPEFFKLLLENNNKELVGYFFELIEISDDCLYKKYLKVCEFYGTNIILASWFLCFGINLAFRECVAADIRNRQSSKAAVEYTKQMKNLVEQQTDRTG